MRNFQKKGRFSRMMQSKFFLMFLGVIILFFFFSMFSFMNKMEETIRNKKTTEDKITELEKSKSKLNSDIAKLKTEEGIEDNIRNKFGLAKEGENMILIIDDKNQTETSKDSESTSFWSILKGWFR
jgi:cell division protein FtsL